jgi:hypothetical protein
MANTKISNLASGAAVSATDVFPSVETAGVGPVKKTAAQIATYVWAHPNGVLPVAYGGTGTSSPSLVAGANVSITGTWPNQTISVSGGGGSGTVNSGVTGQIAYYATNGAAVSGLTVLPVASGGTGTTTPGLVAGANVTITGTWPNQTINATGGGSGTVNAGSVGQLAYYAANGTAVSGLSILPVASGGTGVSSPNIVAGSNIAVTGTWPNQTISVTGGGGTVAMDSIVSPWAGRKWTAMGNSISQLGLYTTPLNSLLGTTLTNIAVSGSSISTSSSNGPGGTIAVGTIPANSELITLQGGINDFHGNATLGAITDTTTATYYGALDAAFVTLQTRAPNATIVYIADYSNSYSYGQGVNANSNYLNQFTEAMEEVAQRKGAHFINLGDIINTYNCDFLTSDKIHPNAVGGDLLARHIYRKLLFTQWTGRTFATPGSVKWDSTISLTAYRSVNAEFATIVRYSNDGVFYATPANTSRASGKGYFEINIRAPFTSATPGNIRPGLMSSGASSTAGSYPGSSAYGASYNGSSYTNGFTVANAPTGIDVSTGGVIQFAVDFTAGNVWIGKNNVWGSGNPAAGTSPWLTFTPGTVGALFPAIGTFNLNGNYTIQGTAGDVSYSPPSGFTVWG